MKTCSRCGVDKDESQFAVRRASRDGLSAACRDCLNEQKRTDYHSSPDEKAKAIARTKKSWDSRCEESPGFNNSWAVWRKLKAEHRVPKWQRHAELVPIYEEAHAKNVLVDHIIPLRGKFVCGLHVRSNLQLLSADLNVLKSNKYPCVVVANTKKSKRVLKSKL